MRRRQRLRMPTSPAMEEKFTTEPDPRGTIDWPTTSRMRKNSALVLIAKTASHSCSVIVGGYRCGPTAAGWMRTSISPRSARIRSTRGPSSSTFCQAARMPWRSTRSPPWRHAPRAWPPPRAAGLRGCPPWPPSRRRRRAPRRSRSRCLGPSRSPGTPCRRIGCPSGGLPVAVVVALHRVRVELLGGVGLLSRSRPGLRVGLPRPRWDAPRGRDRCRACGASRPRGGKRGPRANPTACHHGCRRPRPFELAAWLTARLGGDRRRPAIRRAPRLFGRRPDDDGEDTDPRDHSGDHG